MEELNKTNMEVELEANDVFDSTDDYDESRFSRFNNKDCKRIQHILKENGKVTWGDVYAPWIRNREWYDKKRIVTPEESHIFEVNPDTEMMCVLDESDGNFYWMPKWEGQTTQKKESRIVKWLKNLISTIILIFSVSNMYGQQTYNPEKPMIVPFAVGISSINERVGDTQGHDPLYEDGGYVKIPSTFYTHNGKSKGIIILQTWAGNYTAAEARCPVCYYELHDKNGGVIDPNRPFCECAKCRASPDNLKSWGSGQMFRYKFKGNGPVDMDFYTVKVVEKDNDTYLFIDNAPNGLRDEWKDNPDNQIILEKYKEKYGTDYK